VGHICPACGCRCLASDEPPVPPEPPRGTWVKDRHGGTHQRRVDDDGRDGWGSGPGFYSFGLWSAMWRARGPLVVCGPYGAPLAGGGDSASPGP
jgi:hypothetical protein